MDGENTKEKHKIEYKEYLPETGHDGNEIEYCFPLFPPETM